MAHPPVALTVAFAVLFIAGCNRGADPGEPRASPASTSAASAATQPTEFSGTLRGGAVAIGGETTGWRLEGDGATGGLDLDVSNVKQRAQALQGRRVNVSGKMASRNWPERGATQVLVVDRIDEAPRKEVPGAR